MGSHPVNPAFRFLLEITALFSAGIRPPGIPAGMAIIWGVFVTPDHPGRSEKTVIKTAGPARVVLELAFFAFATCCLKDTGYHQLSMMFAIPVILLDGISCDRIKCLFSQSVPIL